MSLSLTTTKYQCFCGEGHEIRCTSRTLSLLGNKSVKPLGEEQQKLFPPGHRKRGTAAWRKVYEKRKSTCGVWQESQYELKTLYQHQDRALLALGNSQQTLLKDQPQVDPDDLGRGGKNAENTLPHSVQTLKV